MRALWFAVVGTVVLGMTLVVTAQVVSVSLFVTPSSTVSGGYLWGNVLGTLGSGLSTAGLLGVPIALATGAVRWRRGRVGETRGAAAVSVPPASAR